MAPIILPCLRLLTALIPATIGPTPGTNDRAVDTIGLLTTLPTVLITPPTAFLTPLNTPLTALLTPLNILPKKNSGNLPPLPFQNSHHFLPDLVLFSSLGTVIVLLVVLFLFLLPLNKLDQEKPDFFFSVLGLCTSTTGVFEYSPDLFLI